jgi:hypothetical protein
MTASTPTSAAIEQVFKYANITVVGDGLITAPLSANLFTNLGLPRTSLVVPQVGMLDFGTYSFYVQPESRRVFAKDQSNVLDVNSPIVEMLRSYLRQVTTAQLKAVGFNFQFEVTFAESMLTFLREAFFNPTALARIQGPIENAGVRFTLTRSDHALTINLDPAWRKPNKGNLHLNYHVDIPESETNSLDFLNRYAEFCPDASNAAYSLLKIGEKNE